MSTKFFFAFERIIYQGSDVSVQTSKLISHLAADVLDYLFDTFAEDSELKPEAINYVTYKKLLWYETVLENPMSDPSEFDLQLTILLIEMTSSLHWDK